MTSNNRSLLFGQTIRSLSLTGSFLLLYPACRAVGEELGAPAASAPLSGFHESVSLATLLLKVGGSLGIVLVLLVVLLYLIKRMGGGGLTIQTAAPINIVAARMVGSKKQVAILKVCGDFFLVGITDQQINLLARLDSSAELELLARGAGSISGAATFASFLQRAARKQQAPSTEGNSDAPHD